MKPKNLSEIKSQDEFLEHLIDNYYHVLGEGDNYKDCGIWCQAREDYMATVDLHSRIIALEELDGNRVTKWMTTLSAYKDKIKSLRNKPSFEDHPDAKCFVQDEIGSWYKNDRTSEVEPSLGGWNSKNLCDGWTFIQTGKVIGDWKQTFKKAPEKQDSTDHTQKVNDLIAQYVMSYMNHVCENKRQQDEIEYLEEQIAKLKSRTQN